MPPSVDSRLPKPEIFCAILSVIVFAVSLGADFIYDDLARIVQDDRIRSIVQLPSLLTGEYNGDGQDNLYRPLVSLTYAIQYWLHGTTGWPYHLINLILHAAVTVLVCKLARSLVSPTAASRAAWIAGLAFAVHPIHAEPVISIVGRSELICALGYLGSILLLLPVVRDRTPLTSRRALAIVACVAAALLAKEHGLVLPLILLLLWLLRVRLPHVATAIARPATPNADRTIAYAQGPRQRHTLPTAWAILLVGICASVALYIIAREQWLGLRLWWDRSFLDWSIQPLIRSVGMHRWWVPLEIVGRYVELLVFPRTLSMDYGAAVVLPQANLAGPHFWLGSGATLGYVILTALAAIKRNWPQLWLLLCFGITYGVVSNIPTIIGTPMGERLMYIPTIFLFTSAAVCLAETAKKRWATAILIVLAVAWSLRSFDYARRWQDAKSYYAYQLEVQPKSMRIHLAAGLSAMEAGDLDRAAAIAASARETLPGYWDAWIMSGKIAVRQEKYAEAVAFMAKAHELWPSIYTQRQLAEAVVARNLAALKSMPATLPALP